MSFYTYTYSIKNDINVGAVDINALKREIDLSSIIIALNDITAHEDHLHITFKIVIPEEGKSVLDDLVHSHTATPLSDGTVYDGQGKQIIHQTSKPGDCLTYWTGCGDDTSNPKSYGLGSDMTFIHKVGDPINQSKYIDFNCVENTTYLHEGYFTWQNAGLDKVSLEIVPRTVSGTVTSGTNYNIYNNVLVVPANKDGNFQLQSDITKGDGGLVYIPLNDDGTRPTAFWNADWNPETNQFNNIAAAPYGDGAYNLFVYEYPFARFLNKVTLLNSGTERLQSSDSDEIGHGMRLKIKIDTYVENGFVDHDWLFTCFMTMHRQKTL